MTDLATMLRRGPTTFGWAHNQGYRFDGEVRVITDRLGIPAGDR